MIENKQFYYGTVIFFKNDPGWGFIAKDEGGSDIFVHFSDLNGQKGFRTLKAKARVKFQIGTTIQGKPKAINVTVVNDE